MIKIGLLGAAKIAPKAIIKPASSRIDCTVSAIASRRKDKADSFAKKHDIPTAYGGYNALISDPNIDLIYNALPPNRHADLTIAALEQGKSVLCEKPFAMNAREAKAMVDAAKTAKGHLIEAYHYRFHPAVIYFLEAVRSEEIGMLHSLNGIFNVSIPNSIGELRYRPELGGGSLMDLGCYVLHFFRLLTLSEPVIESAKARWTESGVDVAMQTEMQFGSVTAKLACAMEEGTERQIEITATGSKGTATFKQFVHPYRGFDISIDTQAGLESLTETKNLPLYTRSTYAYQLDHVVNVLLGKETALTGGDDALRTMAAIDAVYQKAGLRRRAS